MGALALLLIANSYLWVAFQDYTFHHFDDVEHLNSAWTYRHALERGPGDFLRALTAGENPSRYPPLVPVVTALFCGFAGACTSGVATLSLVLFTPVLLWGVYGTARELGLSEGLALLAAFLGATSSRVVYFSRVYYLDVPLAAMVMAALYFLLASKGFTRRSQAALFGVTAGLGLLTKWTFGIFLLAPVLAVALRSRNRLHVLMAGGIALGLALPWYAAHLDAIGRSYRDLAAEGAPGLEVPLLGRVAPDLAFYARDLLLPHLALAFLVGLGWCLVSRERVARFLPLLLALAFPYAVFSLLVVKDPRFLLPLAPCACLLAVAWLPVLGRWQAVVAVPLVAAGLVGALAWLASPPEGPSRTAALLLGEPRLARIARFDFHEPMLGEGRAFEAMIADMAALVRTGQPVRMQLMGREHHPVLSALYGRTGQGTVYVQFPERPWMAFSLDRLRRRPVDGAPPPGWLLVQEGFPAPDGEPVEVWTLDFAESWRESVRFSLYRASPPAGPP